jgi:hypothetical protein
MNKINGWFLCLIGKHDWKTTIVSVRAGTRFGDRCERCHVWHEKKSVAVSRDQMIEAENESREFPS